MSLTPLSSGLCCPTYNKRCRHFANRSCSVMHARIAHLYAVYPSSFAGLNCTGSCYHAHARVPNCSFLTEIPMSELTTAIKICHGPCIPAPSDAEQITLNSLPSENMCGASAWQGLICIRACHCSRPLALQIRELATWLKYLTSARRRGAYSRSTLLSTLGSRRGNCITDGTLISHM